MEIEMKIEQGRDQGQKYGTDTDPGRGYLHSCSNISDKRDLYYCKESITN